MGESLNVSIKLYLFGNFITPLIFIDQLMFAIYINPFSIENEDFEKFISVNAKVISIIIKVKSILHGVARISAIHQSKITVKFLRSVGKPLPDF